MTKTHWGLLTVLFATLLAAYFAPAVDDEIQPAKEIVSDVKRLSNDSVAANTNNAIKSLNGLSANLKPDSRTVLDRPPSDLFYRAQSKADMLISSDTNKVSKPTAPPLPFIYMGKLAENGKMSVFLTRDEKPYVVHIGDVIDGVYRIDAINSTILEMTYLPLSQKQRLNMISANNGATSVTSAAAEAPVNAQSTSISDTETQRIRDALGKLMGQIKGKQQ